MADEFNEDEQNEVHENKISLSEIPYWDLSAEMLKNSMSVREMGRMLGLNKTDSYWLAHKGEFKVYEIDGKYRVDIADFEKWYANQWRYKKVNGPPPGEELKQRAYSFKEIEDMLQLSDSQVYDVFARDQVETITVDFQKWVPKEAFDKWYHSQNRYRTLEDKERDREIEENSIWLPDVARMLGIERGAVYHLMYGKATRDYFEIIEVASRKRVTKDSFFAWYRSQSKFHLLSEEEQLARENERIRNIQQTRLKRLSPNKEKSKNARDYELKEPRNPKFYTMDEIVRFYGFSRNTVAEWVKKGYIPSMKVGQTLRFPREEFDDWIDMIRV